MSKATRFLGVVLAIIWTLALLTTAWNEFHPSSLADATPKSRDKAATAESDATAPRSAELQPTLVPLPGGGLPIKAADGSAGAQAKAPNRLPDGIAENRLPANSDAPSSSDDPPAANRPRRLSGAPDTPPLNRTVIGQLSTQVPSGASGNHRAHSAIWSQMHLSELMHCLDVPDQTGAARAKEELQRRGIEGQLLDLARLAVASDPEVRRAFVESLPTFSGVDARPWLLEMSYDSDSRVRTAAVTLMATSGDLELLKRVRQAALADPDDTTRAQAEKALPAKSVERR
jgi:HEAT repeats